MQTAAPTAKEKRVGQAIVLFSLLLLTASCIGPHSQPKSFSPVGLPNGLLFRSVTNDGLCGDFFYRNSVGPRKALILLGGSEGGKSWNDHVARINELAERGYGVLSLAYFGVDGLPKTLRAIPLEYFNKAFQWLSEQKEIIPREISVLGVSRGAEVALLLGSKYPEVRTVVAIAPSSVVFPGPPTGLFDALRGQHSAWSFGGRELPCVPIPYSWTTVRSLMSSRRIPMFEKALQNKGAVERGAIPVENIQGPILLVSFSRDQVWPSTPMARQLMARLDNKGFRFRHEHTTYNTTHSDWSFDGCWENILGFLRQCASP